VLNYGYLKLEINNFGPINIVKLNMGKINVVGGVNGNGKSITSIIVLFRALTTNRGIHD